MPLARTALHGRMSAVAWICMQIQNFLFKLSKNIYIFYQILKSLPLCFTFLNQVSYKSVASNLNRSTKSANQVNASGTHGFASKNVSCCLNLHANSKIFIQIKFEKHQTKASKKVVESKLKAFFMKSAIFVWKSNFVQKINIFEFYLENIWSDLICFTSLNILH